MEWLPEHKAGLFLTHNEHKDCYDSIEMFYDPNDFVSDDERNKAIAEDSVWVLQWYPETPIGFNIIAASSLDAIKAELEKMNER